MKKFLFVLVLALSIPIQLCAQWFWENTNGPYGGQIMAVYGDSTSKVFVGTKNGFFVSTDYGENWESYNLNFKNKSIIAIRSLDSFLYAISDYNSIIRLTSDGALWDTIYYSLQERPRAIEITNNGKILMTTINNIYESTDEGENWNSIKDSTMSLYMPRNIRTKGDSIIFFSDGNNRIYRSLNAGDEWEIINQSLPNGIIVELYVDEDGILYTAITDNKIYKSEDDGENWISIDNNYFYSHCHSIFKKGNYLYVGTDQGIYRTSNDGVNWYTYSNGITDESIQYIFGGGNRLFSGTTWAGIFVLDDVTDNWKLKVNGINATKVGSFIADSKNNLFTGIYGNGVYKGTGTSPINWENKSNGLYENFITALAISKNQNTQDHIYLLTESHIYKTTNLGANWTPKNTPCSYSMSSLCINDSGYLFFNSSCGVFRSTNDGDSWDLMNTNSWMGQVKWIVANPHLNNVYVSSENGFYRSTNNGNTWAQISMSGSNALKIKINRKGHLYVLDTFGEISKSTNNGNTFTVINNGLPLTYDFMQDLTFNSEDHIYLATKDGLYVSKNEGATWLLIEETPTSKIVNILEFDEEDRLYAGLINEGVYRSVSILTDINDINNVIESFLLSDNYPNPFNPNTTIVYNLPVSSEVILKVYDVLGKEVTTLVNEEKPAGSYEIEFNVETSRNLSLPSGVYFYQLRAGDYVETKKMVLMK